jgi:Spy/CpxP family protein refolding chaperone
MSLMSNLVNEILKFTHQTKENIMKRLILFLILATTTLWAQPRRMERHERRQGPMMDRKELIEKLDLTADQKKQFGNLQSELQKNQIMSHSKVQLARIDLRQLFHDDRPDRALIEAKLAEIGKLQTDMKLAHVGFWFDVNKMLTADQQKKWKEAPMMMHGREGGPVIKKMIRKRMMGMNKDDDDEDESEDD